ncbi:hypothetical protein C0992_007459 [Termitomyces sp. T32_za158]|nr:hypothetical protein C0992_007459 [Termitomyces sp. T32_za158]
MKAHVVAFESPVHKVHDVLPPPREEIDNVLAVLFTGPCRPTAEDMRRLPLLIRCNAVKKALEWLKLNHVGYRDVSISYTNLNGYIDNEPPVSIIYRESDGVPSTVTPSIFNGPGENEVVSGDCPFIVHGLVGEDIDNRTAEQLKGIAFQHWNTGGKALCVGHSSSPRNSFHDASLYPQMFPWLFPYGLGGIGSATSSLFIKKHKRNLLMYHDKRFQMDTAFPFVAFSHDQVKAATTSSFLAAEKLTFGYVSQRLMSVDQKMLTNLAKRLADGEIVIPDTESEKLYYQVIKDIDSVAGRVDGSIISKKYMNNEIWSLVACKGAPSWYITLSLADIWHPLCLYYASSDVEYKPEIPVAPDEVF